MKGIGRSRFRGARHLCHNGKLHAVTLTAGCKVQPVPVRRVPVRDDFELHDREPSREIFARLNTTSCTRHTISRLPARMRPVKPA